MIEESGSMKRFWPEGRLLRRRELDLLKWVKHSRVCLLSTSDFLSKFIQQGGNAKKVTPATIKELIDREVEINKTQMTFDKDSIKIDLLRKLGKDRKWLESLPNIHRKQIESTMNMAIELLLKESSAGLKALDDVTRDLRRHNHHYTLAKARAQVEISKLHKEMYDIKNNDALKVVKFYKDHEEELVKENDVRELEAFSTFKEPVRGNGPINNQLFPMDMYEGERLMIGEEKLKEDAFTQYENPTDRIFQIPDGYLESSSTYLYGDV